MSKKITFISFFIVFILLITPITQAIGENTNSKFKKELIKTIQKTNVDNKLKNNVIKNLENIDIIDEKTLKYIVKFKNNLEKNNDYFFNNFLLKIAFIHFLWGLYFIIEGDQTAARYHFKRAVINLLFSLIF
jgi:hypothetical protein